MSEPGLKGPGSLSLWLRCPTCSRDLAAVEATVLGCTSGHRFDVNKRGYASLLAARSATTGDTAPMLDAREALLGSGAYEPLLATVDALIPTTRAGRLIDLGTGTGHYLERVLASRPGWAALAMDRSPTAVARSTRRTGADGLVADVWQPWPVRDGAASVILDVFAPRNPPEFHRVLEAGGSLVVVVPHEDHLQQLRAAGLTLSVAAGKAEQLVDELWPWFEHDQSRESRFELTTDPRLIEALIGMGPSAHHPADVETPRIDSVTVAVTVLRFRRRRRVQGGV